MADNRGPDATIFQNVPTAQALRNMHTFEHLPQVVGSGVFEGYQATDGTTVGAPVSPGYGRAVSVPRLIEGRLPHGSDEAAVDWTIAQAHDLHVGNVYRINLVSDASSDPADTTTVTVALHVVGVAAYPDSFPPFSEAESAATLVAPSFIVRHHADLGTPPVGLELRLRGGQAGLAGFTRAAQRAFPHQPMVITSTSAQTEAVENSIHPAAVALWLLGAALALDGILIVFQLFRRMSSGEQDAYSTAAVVGATRRQLFTAELTRTCRITAAASILMVITAIGLSPLFPLGTARVAEPTPGVWVNWSVLGAGILAVVVLTVALALLPSWRTTRAATAPISEHAERVSPGAWSPRWLWLRPVSWVGVTHGLRTGKGASEVPVRASITAMLVAVTGLTGALTFGVSLEHLDSTPELYGWSWGAHIYDNGSAGTPILVPRLAADQWLSGVTVADTGVPLRVDGQ